MVAFGSDHRCWRPGKSLLTTFQKRMKLKQIDLSWDSFAGSLTYTRGPLEKGLFATLALAKMDSTVWKTRSRHGRFRLSASTAV